VLIKHFAGEGTWLELRTTHGGVLERTVCCITSVCSVPT